MARKSPRESILEHSIELFNSKGYHGTSIRDIAGKANVNIANISYYFQGKQGLFEECLIRFFEPYLTCFEEEVDSIAKGNADECLVRAIKKVIVFQSKHYLLSRFVWREVTIDSQISREIIASYLMKERFLLKKLIQASIKKPQYPVSMLVIQLKSMLMMPYINSLYVKEAWGLSTNEPYFVDKYYKAIQSWLSYQTTETEYREKQISIS